MLQVDVKAVLNEPAGNANRVAVKGDHWSFLRLLDQFDKAWTKADTNYRLSFAVGGDGADNGPCFSNGAGTLACTDNSTGTVDYTQTATATEPDWCRCLGDDATVKDRCHFDFNLQRHWSGD